MKLDLLKVFQSLLTLIMIEKFLPQNKDASTFSILTPELAVSDDLDAKYVH